MLSLSEILLTGYFWTVSAIGMVVTGCVCGLSYPFVDQKTFSRIYETVSGTIILNAMIIPGFWSFKITDLRKSKQFDRYIIISNHTSFIDTLLATQIPLKKKFIAARVFMNLPVFGWLCHAAGYVPVDKHDRSTTQPALGKSIKAMEDGCSFMIYPEGQRSDNHKILLPFKTGAFRLSQETGVPILPVVMKGTAQGMRFGGICNFANLELIIGEPIYVGKTREELLDTVDDVRKFMESHI